MHKDEEVKAWVNEHIDQLVEDHCLPGEKEFQAEIELADDEGVVHRYAIFLEYTDDKNAEGWVVRNIVRPEQLE